MKVSLFGKRRCCALAVLVAALVAGCRQRPAVRESKPTAEADPVERRREADDTARFLAGLPGNTGSPFTELECDPAWQNHRRMVDQAWAKAESQGQMIAGLRGFQQQELARAPLAEAPVFYPFGGPDALTPVRCFPHSPTYVLVGLEPAGTLPSVESIQKKPMAGYLAAIRRAMASELGRSFFVTREMDRQFRGQVTDGLLLPILQLLVRTNHTILGCRYVRLDEQGRLTGRPADYHAPGNIGNKGVEVVFRTDADQSVHRLFYLSVNLSDDRLKQDQAFLLYAGRLKGVTTLLKATSYMTHRSNFSMIRNLVLTHSDAVLQDDSGIPFHLFEPRVWKVQLYGDYKRPYGSFHWLVQPDLEKAYRKPDVKPMLGPIGYGYRRIASNLLLAERAH